MPKCLLFIAQSKDITDLFACFREEGIEIGLAENLKGALTFIKKAKPLLVFSRPALPGYKAEELLAQKADSFFPPIIIFSSRPSAEEAQKYLEMGAKDYWVDPLGKEKISAAMPDPTSLIKADPNAEVKSGHPVDIIGQNPSTLKVLALAKQVAPSKASIMISGESGTGKEMFARFIHMHGNRNNKSFIAINCAALPEHLLESELFGHEKGAFTGAISRKPGKFELADGGTLLLDEISEMNLGLQAKLLRVLQEGELDRVGGTETIKVDVRVISTTNRAIEDWVAQGKFRNDLYFRLNVIPLKLPPLRERGEDMILLANFFIGRFCRQYSLPRLTLSPEAVDWMYRYEWPGNVRELQNLMERAVLLAGKGPIRTSHFLLESEEAGPYEEIAPPEQIAGQPATAPREAPTSGTVPVEVDFLGGKVIPLQEMERIMIMRGLEHTSGNRTQAAELLGISVRTLRNKLHEYRLQAEG